MVLFRGKTAGTREIEIKGRRTLMAKETQKLSLEAFQNEVRKLAGEIYKKRTAGKKSGDSLSDWLQAEKEVKKEYGI